ncbi:YihY/virulence factor BrkB family protein [Micrococcoides hystricis]|uniref:YihY/virulence factor BrkB family protein n=1 Tax=Micrococcoides hystricis TaxID=1572761 RepID=A0ABV6P942_9MICC
MARPKKRWLNRPPLTPDPVPQAAEDLDERIHPLDLGDLKLDEVEKRAAYGRAKRKEEGAGKKLGTFFAFFMAKLNTSYPMRAFNLYSRRNGPLMAAGSAYIMFFSIAALLVASFSILGLVVAGNTELQNRIVELASRTIPGLIDTGDGGLAKPEQLFRSTGWGLTLIISVATSLFTALNWINGLRSGIRTIFGVPPQLDNIVVTKGRDLGILLLLGVGLVVTSIIGGASGVALEWVLSLLGLEGSDVARMLTRITTILVMLVLDMLVAWILYRLASGVEFAKKPMLLAIFVAGLGATILRLFSSLLLGGVTNNPVLAPFAVILGLFVWFYFLSQVYFFAAALGTVGTRDREKAEETIDGAARTVQHNIARGRNTATKV